MHDSYQRRVWRAEVHFGPKCCGPLGPIIRLVPKSRFHRAVASDVRPTWEEREQIMAERNANRRKAFDSIKASARADWAL